MISQPLFILLSRKRLAETTFAKSLHFAVYYFIFVTKTEQAYFPMIWADDQRYVSTDRLIWNFLKRVVCTPLRLSSTPYQLTMSIPIKFGFSPIRMLESDFRTIL